MAALKVWKNNQLISEKNLSPSESLTAGRGDDCDLVLEADRGISRQHFKIQFDGESWTLEVLSRYGELYSNNQKIQNQQPVNAAGVKRKK